MFILRRNEYMDKKIKVKKYTGVYLNRNKWHACIGYKNKIYNLSILSDQKVTKMRKSWSLSINVGDSYIKILV